MKKREIKKINFFKSILETQKQTCFNKKNSTQPQMKKKIIITKILYYIKKSYQFIFSL
jgi:hypothetical protein